MPAKRANMMRKVPISKGAAARFDAIQAARREETERYVSQAETIEHMLDMYTEAARKARELREIDDLLREAGITYPPGARGVLELITQRDSYLNDLQERG